MNNKLNVTPTFRLVFSTVLGLTLISGAASFWLASYDKLTTQQIRVFESCSTTWQMGVGAIFGLLGGKATDLFQLEKEDEEEQS